MRLCVAAGGTGGHLLPGLAAAQELRSRGHQVHFVVRRDHASQALLAREGFSSSAFAYAGYPRRFSMSWAAYPFYTLNACWIARRVLRRQRSELVLGMGGYLSVPVGLAAVRMKIPLVVHEQNRRAGLANRFLSRWASAVAVSFPDTEGFPPQALKRFVGLPLRANLIPKDPEEARRALGLSPELLTVLVFGGSQGAHALNRLVMSSLADLPSFRDRWQFIHMTGGEDRDAAEKFYAEEGWRSFVRAYWDDMATLYGAADFVVSRSGANTVMELARLGKPALLVPYPHATNDHQEANARFLEGLGQARVILERDLTKERFQSILKGLPVSSASREPDARRAPKTPAEFSAGASRLADLIEKVSGERAPRKDENFLNGGEKK